MSNKVLRHPEKEKIISKLSSGESVKEVERWLKKKHPKSTRLQISYMTLQKFRKEYLNLEGEVLDQIKQARDEAGRDSKEVERRAMVASSDAYQRKLDEIVSNELDVTRKMLEMEKLISSRLEFYYNILNDGGTLKEEKMFLELLNSQRALMADWKKYVEGVADKTIEHNININMVNEQLTVLKSIVYDVLQDLDPLLIPVFIEKVNSRLGVMNYGDEVYRKQIEVINAE
jgi:hypothetical protein